MNPRTLALAVLLLPLWLTPAVAQDGIASFYHEGQRTANGERYRPDGLTAAHRTLPFGTRVRVTHRGNGRSVVLRINDRGPAKRLNRVIDVSRGAAVRLGMIRSGVAPVSVEVVR
jgi:rare lipoprotein A